MTKQENFKPSTIIKLLENKTTLKIIDFLSQQTQRLKVYEISRALEMHAPTVCIYLGNLHRIGILSYEKVGKSSYYILKEEKLEEYQDRIKGIEKQYKAAV